MTPRFPRLEKPTWIGIVAGLCMTLIFEVRISAVYYARDFQRLHVPWRQSQSTPDHREGLSCSSVSTPEASSTMDLCPRGVYICNMGMTAGQMVREEP